MDGVNIFDNALNYYLNEKNGNVDHREKQLKEVTEILTDIFPFDVINCIETGSSFNWRDGMVGVYFNYLSEKSGGIFYEVDINEDILNLSKIEFDKILNINNINFICDDSVNFLKTTDFVPNLIHLDSLDLNLKDPLPSALHGWMEFEAIKDKMSSGSVIIVDDNYFINTNIEWITFIKDGGEKISSEILEITYPIIGKGAHIYQWAKREDTDWKLIETIRSVGNHKIIVQKV